VSECRGVCVCVCDVVLGLCSCEAAAVEVVVAELGEQDGWIGE